METQFGRTTGNITQDHAVYGQESLVARQKYDRIREEASRRLGRPTFQENLLSIACVIGVASVIFTDNPIKDFFNRLSISAPSPSYACDSSGLKTEIKRLESAGFVVTCPPPK